MAKQTDHATAFANQKPVAKAQVMALKPGTLVEVKWQDSPNTFGILLEKPTKERGDVSLRIWWPENRATDNLSDVNSHAIHSQVVAVHGRVQIQQRKDKPMILLS